MISRISVPFLLVVILFYSCNRIGDENKTSSYLVVGEDSLNVRVIDYEPDLVIIEDIVDFDRDGYLDFKAYMLDTNGYTTHEFASYLEFEVACDASNNPLALTEGDVLSPDLNWVEQKRNVLKIDSASSQYGNFTLDEELFIGLRKITEDDTINAYLKVVLGDRQLLVKEYVDQYYWW